MQGTRFRPAAVLGGFRSGLGQKQPPPLGVCCQLDPAGNTVCSDGQIFPSG